MDGREATIRRERRRIYLEETRRVLRSHHDPTWKLGDDELAAHLIAKTFEREQENPDEARIARRIRDLLTWPPAASNGSESNGSATTPE